MVLADRKSFPLQGRCQSHGIQGPKGQKSGSDDAVMGNRLDQVAGHLLAGELKVGSVFVEGPDHVVAVRPYVLAQPVPLESLALGIPDQIQPVAAPTLSIAGRSKEPVHEVFVCTGLLIADECGYLLGGWRQSEQIKRESPDQCSPIRFRSRVEPLPAEARENPTINWVFAPFRRDVRVRGR